MGETRLIKGLVTRFCIFSLLVIICLVKSFYELNIRWLELRRLPPMMGFA